MTTDGIFGKLTKRWITTDVENINPGDEITLVNQNCEFEFDNVFGVFAKDLIYYYLVDLVIKNIKEGKGMRILFFGDFFDIRFSLKVVLTFYNLQYL